MRRQRTTVLIVDDNDIMRSILRGILRADAYEVVGEARTGAQAIEQVERLRPHIICLDIMMPQMDGLEALPEIRRVHPQGTVVMITSSTEPSTVHSAIEHGASNFIVKPFNAARVLDTLERYRRLGGDR